MTDVYLTFDVEDFINESSMRSLIYILKALKKYNLRALFFITGHMTEKISKEAEILELFHKHIIGYHSSSHSVRPTIPEYTDKPSFNEAVKFSLQRESSHINPLTGEIEGRGGIPLLREIFPDQKVNSFRAPGNCWTPPHLEALRESGVEFEFSGVFNNLHPISYRGITFYPPYFLIESIPMKGLKQFLSLIPKKDLTILDTHPDYYVNYNHWDSIFWQFNPSHITQVPQRSYFSRKINFFKLMIIFWHLSSLKIKGKIKVTPDPERVQEELNVAEIDVEELYKSSMFWCRTFLNYEPIFLLNHFKTYFNEVNSKVLHGR